MRGKPVWKAVQLRAGCDYRLGGLMVANHHCISPRSFVDVSTMVWPSCTSCKVGAYWLLRQKSDLGLIWVTSWTPEWGNIFHFFELHILFRVDFLGEGGEGCVSKLKILRETEQSIMEINIQLLFLLLYLLSTR